MNTARQFAPRATFDRASQQRRVMIAKVKIAQKQLGLTDDDYRAKLMLITGETSAKDLTEAQLARVLEAFQRDGFKATKPRVADHPSARKARALWISLHQLGVVANPSEPALEAFARRQLKVEKLAWANQSQSYRLIEALKAMAERAGWSQSTESVAPGQEVKELRYRLCAAILTRMKDAALVDADMNLRQAAWSLCGLDDDPANGGSSRGVGPMLWSAEQLDVLARALSAKLAAFKAAGA